MMTDKQTILIVDDTPTNISVLSVMLDDYAVLVATSGTEAINIALAQNPDIILLDIMMPDMDGYEVCQQLKENQLTTDIPIIFITALGDAESEEKGLSMGAIDYISKPFVPKTTVMRVKNHLELKRSRDLLKTLSQRDGLTSVANRRYFDIYLKQEFKRASRNKTPLTVALIDIDFFKAYNDCYGHLQGDECLKEVAGILSDIVKRPEDLLARYGGEEFAYILPGTTLENAAILMKTLIINIKNANIEHSTSDVCPHVTLSAGLACNIPDKDSKSNDLLKLADIKLYAAKADGRNQFQM